jgi:hypothetical protein
MYTSGSLWKDNFEEARQNFISWWKGDGFVLFFRDLPEVENLHEWVDHPGEAPDIQHFYTHPEWRASWNHYHLSRQPFPEDTLPIAETNIGPGSLALFIGGEARLSDETVWFEPCIVGDDPESYPSIKLDTESYWWQITKETLQACVKLSSGKYMVGCPDLIENIDIVAALRGPQPLLMDMIDRPDWVIEKVSEVNEAFFAAYERIYEIIKLKDGSSSWDAFRIWGPGKTAKVQCDTSAMFSPAMFEKFVLPALTAQCEWLDYSMYHLDGHQCIQHLDLLLDMEALDAIEWTPDPQVPQGGDPCWFSMYRKILDAGKSLQVIGINPGQVEPLLDAVGAKGVYIQTSVREMDELESMTKVIDSFR